MLKDMNKNTIYLLLGLWLTATIGCATYEQGPDISFLPANQRVVNTWVWAYALENESNMTGIRADSLIEFRNDQVVRICDTSEVNCREGRWNLVRNKEKLQMIFGQEAIAYDIRMLRYDEIWLFYEDPDTSLVIEWELVPK